MTEGVGKQLGDFFGVFQEYDHKNNSSIWRESMRLRIKLDVRRPLKRRKKIIKKNGTESWVTCKYERLGDFCFTCGLMSHTERYCSKFLEKGSEEINREWGSWLRAPPRRMAGPAKSKFLREDGDSDWEVRAGRVNAEAKFTENSYTQDRNQLIPRKVVRQQKQSSVTELQPNNTGLIIIPNKELAESSNFISGPEEVEAIGLQLSERKRMRGGPDCYDIMDTEGGLKIGEKNAASELSLEAVLSNVDCAASPKTDLAMLAKQASQSL